MPKRSSLVHGGLAEAGRDLGLPLKKGQSLGETLIIRQRAFIGPGAYRDARQSLPSGTYNQARDVDVRVSKQTPPLPPASMCPTVLCPGQGWGLCQLPSEKDRESSKLVGTETREPRQVTKVFECHAGMLGCWDPTLCPGEPAEDFM